MRYRFRDVSFNVNSKSKDLPCEGKSKSNDNGDDLEVLFDAMQQRSQDKLAAAFVHKEVRP
jgi:hypothetical protein